MKEITFGMLVGIKIDRNKNPLLPLSDSFINWAKTEGGCWWWIKDGARECLDVGITVYRCFGSPEGIKKEQIFISEFPFANYLNYSTILRKTYSIFQDLLIEEWLNFINGDDMIREELLTRL
jgi:hypothetical protein